MRYAKKDTPDWARGADICMTVAHDLAGASFSLADPPFPDPPLVLAINVSLSSRAASACRFPSSTLIYSRNAAVSSVASYRSEPPYSEAMVQKPLKPPEASPKQMTQWMIIVGT